MSRLVISSASRQITLNATSFSSPLYASMTGTQVKSMAIWFPIKLSQPEVHFDITFATEADFEDFQRWVRAQQLLASQATGLITLNWPERNIINWTGVIQDFPAGGARFNVAPKASFAVLLVDSMVTSRTEQASIVAGDGWREIFGTNAPSGVLGTPKGPEAALLAGVGATFSSILTGTGF